jgi:hypothetical protein
LPILLLALVIAGCFSTQHVPLRSDAPLERATGVRTISGEEVEFAVTGATIVNDTLRAVGEHGTLVIPTDRIAKISIRKLSVRNTTGLVLGVGAICFLLLAVLAVGNLATIN